MERCRHTHKADSAYSHPGRARDADLSIALETVAQFSGPDSKDRPTNYEFRPINRPCDRKTKEILALGRQV